MHIFSMKNKTKRMGIQKIPDAPILYTPLLQHIGQPAIPQVKIGELVYKYQLIGLATGGISANVHSPVSGEVIDIKDYPLADGTLVPTVIIENDFKEKEIECIASSIVATSEQIVEIIANCGIVGEGGAQFPTAIKYMLEGNKINTFIVNGTECEPYLTADFALMEQHAEELLNGIEVINRVLEANDVVITIEEQNKILQYVFKPFLERNEYNNIRIVILPNQYPQGGELQLIKSITGIELPRNQRPRDIGVIVSNVATIYSVYKAVYQNIPLISRFITISGEKLKNNKYGNYEVKIGTPVSHILQTLEIEGDHKNIVLGGPMMGKQIENLSAPITKGSSGILFLKEKDNKRNHCISCGYCVEVCPMHLMPMKFEEIYRKGKFYKLDKYSISNCVECAACEYICPSNVPLISSIKEGKIKSKELANAIE